MHNRRSEELEAQIDIPGSGFGDIKENGKFSGRGIQNMVGAVLLVSFIFIFDLWRYLPIPRTLRAKLSHGGLYSPHVGRHPGNPESFYHKVENIMGDHKQRSSCPHYQAMGCLGDALEKLCESDTGSVEDILGKTNTESVWMCCCPQPYAPCALSERKKKCDAAMRTHIELAAPASRHAARSAVLAVRAELRREDPACSMYFTALDALPVQGKPDAKVICGAKVQPNPVSRSIAHPGLFCETVTWQWEELGDGDSNEFRRNNCPVPYTPRKEAPERKSASLTASQLP